VQPLDFHGLGHLEKDGQVLVLDVHLAAVHEVQQTGHVAGLHVGHQQDGVTRWVLQEDLLEVGTANGKDLQVETKEEEQGCEA